MQRQEINWPQYRALLRATFLMETRGRTAVKPYRRTASLVFSYLLASGYLAWSLASRFYEPAYVLISFTVSMYLAGLTVITSYSFHLLDSSDERILHQFPISEKTLFAVRSTNLFLYIFLVSIPFYLPLAFFFYLHAAEPDTVAYFLVVLFLYSFWTSCLFLILYNVLTQLFSNTTRLFSNVQIVFILLLLFFYQSLPGFDSSAVDWQKLLTGVLPYVFPPIWYCSLFWSLQGYAVIPAQTVAMLLGSGTLILFLLLLRSRLLLLPRVTMTLPAEQTRRQPLHRIFFSLMTIVRPRERRKKGGFDFLRTQLHRDRLLQIHLLPVLLMPVAITVYGLLTGQCRSPMYGQLLKSRETMMHLPIIIFYMFATRHVIQTITHTRFVQARWIFQMIDSRALEQYAKGVYSSVQWNVMFPLAFLLALLLAFAMPPLDAALHGLFLLLGSRFQIATWTVFQTSVPFSQYEDKFTSAQRMTQFLFIIPYIALLCAFQTVASLTIPAYLVFLAGLEIASRICITYLHRRNYAVQVQ